MSSLAEFVNEHRSKGTNNRTYFNVATLGSKVTNSFSGFFKASESADDTERLTETSQTQNGQLPSSRNRRLDGWIGFSSSSSNATTITADSNPCGLNRFQRIVAFFLCLFCAGFCFTTAMMLIPILVLQTRRFAALNTLGSVFFIVSFGFLWGPLPYSRFLFSEQRRLVTAMYLLTVLFTLYTSLWLHSTVLTIGASLFQAFALVWFLLSYVPGGENGLKWMGRLVKTVFCAKQSSTLVLPM